MMAVLPLTRKGVDLFNIVLIFVIGELVVSVINLVPVDKGPVVRAFGKT